MSNFVTTIQRILQTAGISEENIELCPVVVIKTRAYFLAKFPGLLIGQFHTCLPYLEMSSKNFMGISHVEFSA
jgi:hypothetical protein